MKDELKDIAPNLSGLPVNEFFKVPEDYFDNLPGIIQGKCQKNTGREFVWKNAILKYAIASFAIALLVAGYFFIQQSQIANDSVADLNVVKWYVEEDLVYELDDTDLAPEEYTEDEVQDQVDSETLDEMEEYLMDIDADEIHY